jgi:hypothetical protein
MHHTRRLTPRAPRHAGHLCKQVGAHELQPTPQVHEFVPEFRDEAVAALEDDQVDLERRDFREEIEPIRQERSSPLNMVDRNSRALRFESEDAVFQRLAAFF